MNNLFDAEAERRLEELTELMGMGTYIDSQVRTLSTGQVHRLGLARAMIHRPSVLLLDEPTRSLDPIAAADFRRFLKTQLVERHGTTILFASHTLAEVEQLADRVVLLDKGRMLACDSPRGLRACNRRGHAGRGPGAVDSARLSGRGVLVNSQRMWRKVLAFFRRDVAIARSYRIAFALEILEAFFGVATFYYLSRFVSNDELSHALPAGGDYFGFALVGFAFFDYLTVSMSAFDGSITEAQQNGTLEAMLVTETPLTMILVASAAYPFVLLAMRTVIYLAWGVLFFHFPIHQANWLGAAIILIGFNSGVCRPGDYFDRLSPAVQARQSGALADRGGIQPAGRHDVSGVGAARALCNGWRGCFRSLTHWKECGRRCWRAPRSRNSGRRCAPCCFLPWSCCRFRAWCSPGRCAAPRSPARLRICDKNNLGPRRSVRGFWVVICSNKSTMTGVILRDFSPEGSRAYRHMVVRVHMRCALDPFDFARQLASSG